MKNYDDEEEETYIRSGAEGIGEHLWDFFRWCEKVGYYKFDVRGVENVPKDGRYVMCMNHAGWLAMDALALGYTWKYLVPGKRPKIFVNEHLFNLPFFAQLINDPKVQSEGFGAISKKQFREWLDEGKDPLPIAIFPEGEEGNCSPFWEAYQQKPWKFGAYAIAKKTKAPILPVAIIGGEETCPVAWKVKWTKKLLGTVVGLPAFPVPLPTTWKIVICPPRYVDEPYDFEAVRRTIQKALDEECQNRTLYQVSRKVLGLKRFIFG
jgi:1-acyl-sn-glycerol-3-phosphate acyltransferase